MCQHPATLAVQLHNHNTNPSLRGLMSASFEPEVQTRGLQTKTGSGPKLNGGPVLQGYIIPHMDFVQFASEDSMQSLIAHAC